MAAKVLAAAALFAERGLDGATMSDIAEATGIPRATLYYYFEGKEAVFACMCGLVLDRFEEVLAAALAGGGSAAERLGRVVRAQLGFCAEHPAAFLAMHLDLGRAARRAEMSQRILRSYLRPVAALLEEGATDGTMRPVTSPRVAAAALLGATTTAVEQALLSADEPSGPDPSVIALYEPIMSLVLHGLGTAEEAPALYAEELNS
jgi:AcrR family transcriptional regulator